MTRPYDRLHADGDRGLVSIKERRGLRCGKCGQATRAVLYVSTAAGEFVTSLEGCRACCSGIYATPVED